MSNRANKVKHGIQKAQDKYSMGIGAFLLILRLLLFAGNYYVPVYFSNNTSILLFFKGISFSLYVIVAAILLLELKSRRKQNGTLLPDMKSVDKNEKIEISCWITHVVFLFSAVYVYVQNNCILRS